MCKLLHEDWHHKSAIASFSPETGGVILTEDSIIWSALRSGVSGVRIILKCFLASILTEETKWLSRFNGIWNKMPRPVVARRWIVTVCSERVCTYGHAYMVSSPLFTLCSSRSVSLYKRTVVTQLQTQQRHVDCLFPLFFLFHLQCFGWWF